MNFFDLETIAFAASTSALVFALVPLALVTIFDPDEKVSLHYWAAGALAIGLSALAMALSGLGGHPYIVAVANGGGVLGFGWIYIASRRLLGLSKGRRYVYLLAGAVLLLGLVLEVYLQRGPANLLLTSAALTVFPTAIAAIFSRYRHTLPPLVAAITASLFWAIAVVYLARAGVAVVAILLDTDSTAYEDTAFPYYLELILCTWLGAMLAIVVGARIQDKLRTERDRVAEANDRLLVLSTTDSLTGLANRFQIDSVLTGFADSDDDSNLPLSVLMVDVDHFKDINDRFGHPTGDQVLTAVAAQLRAGAGTVGTVGRWGGEEFIVLLPGVDHAAARDRAARLRHDIATHDFGLGRPVTASIGVATADGAPPDTTEVLRRADSALYTAKHSGRNRVAVG